MRKKTVPCGGFPRAVLTSIFALKYSAYSRERVLIRVKTVTPTQCLLTYIFTIAGAVFSQEPDRRTTITSKPDSETEPSFYQSTPAVALASKGYFRSENLGSEK